MMLSNPNPVIREPKARDDSRIADNPFIGEVFDIIRCIKGSLRVRVLMLPTTTPIPNHS
jgi:hypothetical protein